MEKKPEAIIKKAGRPKKWAFDALNIGEWQEIPCKQKEQERNLDSVRALCIKYSVNGKSFKASRVANGVMIEREK